MNACCFQKRNDFVCSVLPRFCSVNLGGIQSKLRLPQHKKTKISKFFLSLFPQQLTHFSIPHPPHIFDTNLQVPLEGGEAGRTVTAGSMLLLTGQVRPIIEGHVVYAPFEKLILVRRRLTED